MRHLRVELDAVHAGVVGHGRDRGVLAVRDRPEARRHLADAVSVAHPHGGLVVHALEQLARVVPMDDREAVLPRLRRHDVSAQLVRYQLHAVADAQHRNAAVEDPRLRQRRAIVVNRGGASGENDALQVEPGHSIPRCMRLDELAVDVLLAQAARYQTAVLRAEVDDGDTLRLRRGRSASSGVRASGALAFLCDAKVGRNLDISGRGNAVRTVGMRSRFVVVRQCHSILDVFISSTGCLAGQRAAPVHCVWS